MSASLSSNEPLLRSREPSPQETDFLSVSVEPRERRQFAPRQPGSLVGPSSQTCDLHAEGAATLLSHLYKRAPRVPAP